ncbi:MAG: TMEM165/GDT1 family protein [Gammaproteobacteria bacterium]|nr:TMEM165/GDT1 family protein [Gammaproteobacteria bacterium]
MNALTQLSAWNWTELLAVSGSSYLLIFAAEIGDKSQLVCMMLAARYKPYPVLIGSTLAFIFLNTLAVIFGVAIANWIPEVYVSAIVCVLFAAFGIHALRAKEEDDGEESVDVKSSHSILITTFLLISVAEFGDKTQLAVVALSSTSLPIAVWIGSTIALFTTSALGVWAGRTLLQRIPISMLHKTSGVIFLCLALYAAYKTYMLML